MWLFGLRSDEGGPGSSALNGDGSRSGIRSKHARYRCNASVGSVAKSTCRRWLVSVGLMAEARCWERAERSIREAEASSQEARRLVMRRPVGKAACPRHPRYSTKATIPPPSLPPSLQGALRVLKIHKRATRDIRRVTNSVSEHDVTALYRRVDRVRSTRYS